MDSSLLIMVAVMIIIIEIAIINIMRTVRIMLLNELSTVLIMTTPEEEIIFLRIIETTHELCHISSIGILIYYI